MLSATINKLINSYLPFFIFLFSMTTLLQLGVDMTFKTETTRSHVVDLVLKAIYHLLWFSLVVLQAADLQNSIVSG